jgi:chitodextrinase
MKKLLFLVSAFLFALTARGYVEINAPSTVNSGEGYDVGFGASGANHTYGELYKNGAFVASGDQYEYWSLSIAYWATDYNSQTVHYYGVAYYNDEWWAPDSTSRDVVIVVPNTAPSITWTMAPSNAAVNEWFNIQARGNDSDGNLVAVRVWREWVPHAFNGGGNGSENYSDANGSYLPYTGTVTFMAEAEDSNGATSGFIYHTVNIYQPNRSPDNPAISSDGVTQINLGQSVHITGSIHDPDGNLTAHALLRMAPGEGWVEMLSGSPSDGTNSSVSTYFTPSSIGTWYFHTNGYDGEYWGPGATLSVTVVDGTAPTVPGGLGSSNVAATSFTLSWSASSDNVGVTAYEVRRDSTSLGTTGSTSMAISGLTQGTTYSMTVRARDAAGNWSGWSSALPVMTSDTQAPTVPGGLAAGSVAATSFTLSWNASSDNIGVTAYEVRRDSTSLGTTAGTSMAITGLTNGTGYSMTVRARDAAGNWSAWSSALPVTTVDTQAPSVPGGLASSGVTPNQFTLSWNASTDNVGVTAYEVKKGTTSLGTTSATSMGITSLVPSNTYAMTVRARDAAGNWSGWSSALNVTTSPPTSTTDTDNDGVPDVIETQLGTNPNAGPDTGSSSQSALKIHRPTP